MKWLLLLASITFEVGGTTMLKFAGRGGEHAWKWGVGVVLSYIVCFVALGVAMRLFPLGVLYGLWAGGGVMMVATIGVLYFDDEISVLKVVSFVLIVVGIVGLNFSGVSN
ncbi:MAG: small multidrug resistance pump [Verrucomicrobiales bacterium]|jgi:small multidrug resistance pump